MLLAGCAGDGSMRATAEAVGLATTPQEPRTFVQQSRRVDAAYIPVGTVVTRQARRKTVQEFKAIESSLDAKRGANDAAGARARSLGATAPAQPAILPTN
jgi:hypothetical protein